MRTVKPRNKGKNKLDGGQKKTPGGKSAGDVDCVDIKSVLIDAIDNWWSELFFILAPDGKILYVNDAVCRKTRFSRQQLLTMYIKDIDPKYNGQAWVNHIQKLRERGVAFCESSHLTLGEENIPFLIQTFPMKYRDREYFYSITRDITLEKREKNKFEAIVQQYHWLAENMTEGVLVMDMHLNMVYMSPSTQKMSGYTFEEFSQLTDAQKFTPESARIVKETAAAGLKRIKRLRINEKLHDNIELECIRKDGTTLWCDITISLIGVENNKPSGVLLIIKDVSRRRLMRMILQENEQRYRSLFQYNPLATYSLDLQGRFTSANAAACSLAGYTEEEALRMNFGDVVAPEYLTMVGHNFQESMKGGAQNYESAIVRKDGKRINVKVTSSPIVIDNYIVGVYGIAEDISQRNEILESLKTSEEKYRSVVENTGEAIVIAQDKMMKYVNAGMSELLGYTNKELTSKPFIEFIHPDDREFVLERHVKRIKGEEETIPYECRLIDRRANEKIVKVNGVMSTWQGRPATLNFLNDITSQKTAENIIRKLNDALVRRITDLEMANTEIEAFAYAVSHDLTAPLRSINGFSLALQEECAGKLDPLCDDYLVRIRSASQRMSQQIEDMLMLSRIIKAEMNWDDVDLSAIARKFAEELRQSNPSRWVKFVIQDGMVVTGDRSLLETALENLLRNAWKFTGKQVKAHVEFGSRLIDNEQTFYISDDGAGFDMRYAERLFIPFQRMHTAEEFPGNGVGLATVKRIIGRHGGNIWAESEVEKGTTVYFTVEQRTGGTG